MNEFKRITVVIVLYVGLTAFGSLAAENGLEVEPTLQSTEDIGKMMDTASAEMIKSIESLARAVEINEQILKTLIGKSDGGLGSRLVIKFVAAALENDKVVTYAKCRGGIERFRLTVSLDQAFKLQAAAFKEQDATGEQAEVERLSALLLDVQDAIADPNNAAKRAELELKQAELIEQLEDGMFRRDACRASVQRLQEAVKNTQAELDGIPGLILSLEHQALVSRRELNRILDWTAMVDVEPEALRTERIYIRKTIATAQALAAKGVPTVVNAEPPIKSPSGGGVPANHVIEAAGKQAPRELSPEIRRELEEARKRRTAGSAAR